MMEPTTWTEEDRAAVWRLLRAAKDRWYIAGEDDRRDYDDMRADAVLDLLAGLRERCSDVPRDASPTGMNEADTALWRDSLDALAEAVDAVSLLPSDGPPADE